ncbi:MAG: hypothetical protein ACI35S_05270 [Anaeroplasma sp.]
MINRESYNEWIYNKLSELLDDDIVLSVHDEFSYDPNANVDVIVKFLPGQIQCGIPQYPCELLIEINELYFSEVIKKLTDITLTYNESLIDIDNETYRQYYSTPNVVGTFQNRGLSNNVAVSISLSLIYFTNLLMVKRIILSDNDISNEINFVDFSMSYMVNTNSSGTINDPIARIVGESTATTYTFTFAAKEFDIIKVIIEQMFSKNIPNKEYVLSVDFGYNTFINKVILQAGSLAQSVNGVPLIQVTFMDGDLDG